MGWVEKRNEGCITMKGVFWGAFFCCVKVEVYMQSVSLGKKERKNEQKRKGLVGFVFFVF